MHRQTAIILNKVSANKTAIYSNGIAFKVLTALSARKYLAYMFVLIPVHLLT